MEHDDLLAAYNHLGIAKLILKHCGNVLHEDLDAPIADLEAQINEAELKVAA